MGVVYEAQDTRLPRSVAIKFLKPSLAADTIAVKRFKREARLSASLNHPNICTILDIEDGEGEPFIAMELLQGISLRRRLETGPLTLHEIVDIMVQVADALGAAHDHGIMHRDLTPGNIFLTSGGLVKLLDFGLAKQQSSFGDDGHLSDDLTAWGATAGTIHYMSPEQLVENGATDHRSDLFSAGAVLYQMATGTRPFEGVSKSDVIALIRGETQLPVRRFSPEHPQALERIVDRLLAKRPDDRYQTAWTLRADLESLKQPATQVQESSAAQGRPERGIARRAALRSRRRWSAQRANRRRARRRHQRAAGYAPRPSGRTPHVDARAGRRIGAGHRPPPRRRFRAGRHRAAHRQPRACHRQPDRRRPRAIGAPAADGRAPLRRPARGPGRHRKGHHRPAPAVARADVREIRAGYRSVLRLHPRPAPLVVLLRGWLARGDRAVPDGRRTGRAVRARACRAGQRLQLPGPVLPDAAAPGLRGGGRIGPARIGDRRDARCRAHPAGARQVRRRVGLGRDPSRNSGARCASTRRTRWSTSIIRGC